MESPRHGTVGQPTGERAGVYPGDFGKPTQVLKRRMTWIELSVRKLNLIVHWGERTGRGCVFIDVCLLKKRGHVKEGGNGTPWTMSNGGRAAWRAWEMGGEVAQGRGNSFFHLTHAYILFPSVYILFYKIYVGPFQTTVWLVPREKSWKNFLKTTFFPWIFFRNWVQNTGKIKIRYLCYNLFVTTDSSQIISKNLAVERLL